MCISYEFSIFASVNLDVIASGDGLSPSRR